MPDLNDRAFAQALLDRLAHYLALTVKRALVKEPAGSLVQAGVVSLTLSA